MKHKLRLNKFHAAKAQPGIVDTVGSFYAQHSGLIKMLGGAALAITMAK